MHVLARRVVAVIDLDPQSTATNWSDRRSAETPVVVARAAHGDAGNLGLVAAEYQPKSKAAQEMAALYAYIAIALKEKKNREEEHASCRA